MTDDTRPAAAARLERIAQLLTEPHGALVIRQADAQAIADQSATQGAEIARLRTALGELLPIARRMQAACDGGETLCYDNEHDARDAEEYEVVISRAYAALTSEAR